MRLSLNMLSVSDLDKLEILSVCFLKSLIRVTMYKNIFSFTTNVAKELILRIEKNSAQFRTHIIV
jgi:hypothetical protein